MGIKYYVFALLFMNFTAQAEPCVVVTKTEVGAQVIPVKGKVLRNLSEKDGLECGSVISTHEAVFWVRDTYRIEYQFGPGSFFEIDNKNRMTLHRGRMVIQGPQQKNPVMIQTPQSEIEFHGGVVYIEALPNERMTQVAAFQRKVWFRNRYNLEAEQVIEAGEMSTLTFNEARLIPTQPHVISAPVATELLKIVKLSAEEQSVLTETMVRVRDDRMKSMTSELDDWRQIEKPQAEGRSLASETKKDVKSFSKAKHVPIEVLQAQEAEMSIHLLKRRMMGEDIVGEVPNKPKRAVASLPTEKVTELLNTKLRDTEQEDFDHVKRLEKQKILKTLNE